MPPLGRLQIPPPKDWSEFEDITLDALRIRWSSPSLEKNGRSGQPQSGVDIWGTDDLGRPIGVQCKLTEGDLLLHVVESELKNAELFQSPFSVFYIAIIAKTDVKIQVAVRLLSHTRALAGQCAVGIVFWESLLQNLIENPATLKKHFPSLLVDTSHTPTKAGTGRLLALLDVGYFGTSIDTYLKLLFGEFGEMAGNSEQEFAGVLATYRGVGPVVFEPGIAADIERDCRELETAVERAWRENSSWEPALVLAAKLRATADALQYRLADLEFFVYEAGRRLGAWTFVETNNKSIKSKDRNDLEHVLIQLFGGDLTTDVKEHFKSYDENMEHMRTVHIPGRIYDAIRRSLNMSALGLTTK